MLLMLMIASFVSGGLAFLLMAAVGSSASSVAFSLPGIVIGGFFAFKYATYDKNKAREAEHSKRRRDSKH
jgi:hypothetical protein